MSCGAVSIPCYDAVPQVTAGQLKAQRIRSSGHNLFKGKKNPFEVSHHLEYQTMNVSGNMATQFLKVMAVPIETSPRGETLRNKKPACVASFYG